MAVLSSSQRQDSSFQIPTLNRGALDVVLVDTGDVAVVDPGNPAAYQTIQQAIDATAAQAATVGSLIIVKSFATYPENLSVPAGVWEIQAQATQDFPGTTISGTITFTATNLSRLTLTNINHVGAITATLASGDGWLVLNQSTQDGSITATGGSFHLYCQGFTPSSSLFCGVNGAISITGSLHASQFYFSTGPITIGRPSPLVLVAQGCFFDMATSQVITCTGGSGAFMRFNTCLFQRATTFAFTGGTSFVQPDSWSMSNLLAVGTVLTACSIQTLDSNVGLLALAQTNNIALFNFFGSDPPAGGYMVSAALIITTAGTAGTLQPVINYTDELGNVTRNVGNGLAITATGRSTGAPLFFRKTTGNIQLGATGITTPGAVVYQLQFTLEYWGNP